MPLSILYWMVTALRNFFFDIGWKKSDEFDFPIISVGNITVGGTGKTPHVEFLIRILGIANVAILSRGYGRKTKGFRKVETNSTPEESGDEPVQMVSKFEDLSFFVDEKRVNGVQNILKDFRPNKAIILDDAYQHRHIKPGFQILLIDYNRLIHKDFILPAGNLRESSKGKKRADLVIISKCPENLSEEEKAELTKRYKLPHQEIYFTSVIYSEAKSFDGKLVELDKKNILLVTGIANPAPLRSFINSCATVSDEIVYPDHYQFNSEDLQNIKATFNSISESGKLILTTEKDKTRILNLISEYPELEKAFCYIPIEIQVLFNEENKLKKQITQYVDSI